MSDRLIEFAQGEYDFLRAREGRDFFLALLPYANALHGREVIREILSTLEAETREAMERFVAEQNELIEVAKAIRVELAATAPEIDNSDMEEPDHASHDRMRYDLDSFANFDRLADTDHRIAYPVLPRDDVDPGPVTNLLGILRGRLSAAQYGEDGDINRPPIRDDLGGFHRRIGNLGERHRASLQRYRQESRMLPGLAYGRLVYFGSDLVADPVVIETEEDVMAVFDRSLREWLQPKTLVRKLANGERMDDVERRSTEETETVLKAEAERLHRELVRRLELRRRSVLQFVIEEPLAVTIIGTTIATVIAGIIVGLIFGT